MTRVFLAVASLALILLAAAETYHFLPWDFDDAFIVYRIVRNILRGDGWAFNPGEIHNASTSVLNTVVVTLGNFVIPDVSRAAHLLDGCWLAVTGLAMAWIFRAKFGDAIGLAAGTAIIVVLAEGSTWGIETHLFFCLLSLFLVVETRRGNSWYLIGLLTLARPDALLVAGLRWLRSFAADRSLSIRGVLQFLLVLAPWIVYSLIHFHQVFPDTLSNKIWQGHSGYWGRGPVYLKGIVFHLQLAPLWVQAAYVLSLPGIWRLIRDRSPLLYAVAFVALQQTAYLILNVPGYHWYYSILDGVVVLAACYGVGTLYVFVRSRGTSVPRTTAGLKSGGYAGSALFVAALAATGTLAFAAARSPQSHDGREIAYRKAALALKDLPPGAVATVEVGSFGFHLDTHAMLDLTGLTSPNPEFITGKNNDRFFALAPPTVLFHSPLWLFEQALYDDLRFRMMYGSATVIPDPAIAMQYFLLKPGAHPPSEAEIAAHVKEHYSPFQPVAPGTLNDARGSSEFRCTLDQLNGQLAAERPFRVPPPVLGLAGWADDRGQRGAVPELYALLTSGGARFAVRANTIRRPDVAAHLKDPSAEMSGFDVQGSIVGVPPGTYRLGIARRRGDGFVYCEFPNPFSIVAPGHTP